MQVTEKWLKEEYVCAEGLDWFLNQSETDLYKLINKLIEEKHENWANWLITTAMSRQQKLEYAITCAELVLPVFEEEYPNDGRPRAAIEAAKAVLAEDSEENRKAGYAAADAAWAAACSTGYAAAYAADAAGEAACLTGYAAVYAAYATNWEPILEIGIKILKGNK